jgi:hypothetical protein
MLRWQSIHTTKRPAADIKIPIGWDKEETPLADIAYFNSLIYKVIIRFYLQLVVNKSYAKTKVAGPTVWGAAIPQNGQGMVRNVEFTPQIIKLVHY